MRCGRICPANPLRPTPTGADRHKRSADIRRAFIPTRRAGGRSRPHSFRAVHDDGDNARLDGDARWRCHVRRLRHYEMRYARIHPRSDSFYFGDHRADPVEDPLAQCLRALQTRLSASPVFTWVSGLPARNSTVYGHFQPACRQTPDGQGLQKRPG